MLLTSAPLPEPSDDWCYEVKFDGMRAQVAVEAGGVRLRSRTRLDWSSTFCELGALAAAVGTHSLLLDGELICVDSAGRPDFHQLRAHLAGRQPNAASNSVRFMAFDLLHLDGWSVRALPYSLRREMLEQLELHGEAWSCPRTFCDGASLTKAVREHQLEGVVAKRLDSAYLPGRRSRSWIKSKQRCRNTYLVVGVAPAAAGRPQELLLSRADDDGRLRPAGRVSFGLAASERENLLAALKELPTRGRRRSGVRLVEPEIEVEVDAHGGDGLVRDPILRSWRPSHRSTRSPAR